MCCNQVNVRINTGEELDELPKSNSAISILNTKEDVLNYVNQNSEHFKDSFVSIRLIEGSLAFQSYEGELENG